MKALIVLLLSLILLGGAGFGSWTLYKEFMVKKEEEVKAPPPKPAVVFVRMQSVVVPVIDDNKVKQFVTVVATVQCNQDKQLIVQANIPRIQNALLGALYDLAGEHKLLSGPLVNIAAVKARFVDVVRNAVKEEGIQDVLIQVVMQRNL